MKQMMHFLVVCSALSLSSASVSGMEARVASLVPDYFVQSFYDDYCKDTVSIARLKILGDIFSDGSTFKKALDVKKMSEFSHLSKAQKKKVNTAVVDQFKALRVKLVREFLYLSVDDSVRKSAVFEVSWLGSNAGATRLRARENVDRALQELRGVDTDEGFVARGLLNRLCVANGLYCISKGESKCIEVECIEVERIADSYLEQGYDGHKYLQLFGCHLFKQLKVFCEKKWFYLFVSEAPEVAAPCDVLTKSAPESAAGFVQHESLPSSPTPAVTLDPQEKYRKFLDSNPDGFDWKKFTDDVLTPLKVVGVDIVDIEQRMNVLVMCVGDRSSYPNKDAFLLYCDGMLTLVKEEVRYLERVHDQCYSTDETSALEVEHK